MSEDGDKQAELADMWCALDRALDRAVDRRWYRPTREDCAAGSDARGREAQIYVAVTARVLGVPIDVAVAIIEARPMRDVIDAVQDRHRLDAVFRTLRRSAFGRLMDACHAESVIGSLVPDRTRPSSATRRDRDRDSCGDGEPAPY